MSDRKAVREARDKLEELTKKPDGTSQLPGVDWLPVICKNTLELPPSWEDLGGLSGELPKSPYQGLSAFEEKSAEYFFGRENFVDELVAAVETKALVPVVGASGSGKSSVVFAGLLPRLRKQGNVKIASFRPGNNPFDNLAIALSHHYQPPVPPGELPPDKQRRLEQLVVEVDLRGDETRLAHLLAKIIASSEELIAGEEEERTHLVLIADQFEELYRCSFQKVNQNTISEGFPVDFEFSQAQGDLKNYGISVKLLDNVDDRFSKNHGK